MRSGRWIVVGVMALGWMSAGIVRSAEPDGKAIYEAQCGMCHGRTGVPTPGFAKKKAPDFTDKAWQESHTDAQIAKSIGQGVSGTMMRGFSQDLKPGEIEAIVKHLRSFKGAKS